MLFFFDYADPLSWSIELIAGSTGAESSGGIALQRFPFATGDLESTWTERAAMASRVAEELDVPWSPELGALPSQKAFELAFHAAEAGCFEVVHAAIFEARFKEGRDIGRIDVLVEIAIGAGLDWSETKAVLDVDRHTDAVRAWQDRGARGGVTLAPTVVVPAGPGGPEEGKLVAGEDALAEVRRWVAESDRPWS